MASGGRRQDVGRDENVHVNTDRDPYFDIFDEDGDALDASAWALAWDLFLAGASVVSKTSGAAEIVITDGANSETDPTIGVANQNRATVTIVAANWSGLDPSKRYKHNLRRTDSGFADIVAYGDWVFVG